MEEKSEVNKLNKAKELIQSWVNQQGHDRCWYYPEIFEQLVKLFEIKQTKPSSLPPLKEFKKGCKRYQNKEYELSHDSDLKVINNYFENS